MQRRLVEELKELEDNIQSIKDKYANGTFKKYSINVNDENWQRIFEILYKLLGASDKSFEVNFKGKDFNFIYPTTTEEECDMHGLRIDLIDLILQECYDQMLQGNDVWWMVTAFASGIDTLDMQIEIVKEDVTNRVDENGHRITALPLDMDNYQIEMQRPEIEYDKQDQALDL